MEITDKEFLVEFLESIHRDFTILTIPQALASELSKANRHLAKQCKKHAIKLPQRAIDLCFNSYLFQLRLLSNNTELADKIPDKSPLWEALKELTREARLAKRQDPSVGRHFILYSEDDITKAVLELKALSKESILGNEEIATLLRDIQKNYRFNNRSEYTHKSFVPAYIDFDALPLTRFLQRLKDTPQTSYDPHVLKGLANKVLNRREKRKAAGIFVAKKTAKNDLSCSKPNQITNQFDTQASKKVFADPARFQPRPESSKPKQDQSEQIDTLKPQKLSFWQRLFGRK